MTELETLRAAENAAFRAYMARLEKDPDERTRRTWQAREAWIVAQGRVELALVQMG